MTKMSIALVLPLAMNMYCLGAEPVADPGTGRKTPALTWPQDLLSGSAEEAVRDALKQRLQALRVLSRVLKEEESESNRARIASAIRIAGILRAAQLTNQLVEKINFLEHGLRIPTGAPSAERDYIAVGALIQIGRPSIKPTIEKLSRETDPFNRFLCFTVIKKVEGAELARITLERAIEGADGARKKNLQEALKLNWP